MARPKGSKNKGVAQKEVEELSVSPSVPTKAKDSGDGEPQSYEIEDAANTLMKAEKIKSNKKLMPHVHKHLKGQKSAIESIADLRAKKEKMDDESFGD